MDKGVKVLTPHLCFVYLIYKWANLVLMYTLASFVLDALYCALPAPKPSNY